jgi:hypothetical protein
MVMQLGSQNFVANNPANAGPEMYTALMAPGTPVPARYMYVNVLNGAPPMVAVPLAAAANFQGTPGFPHPVPINAQTFAAPREILRKRVEQQGICVHQRGYAITDASGATPMLSTMSIAPCIVIIVHHPHLGMGALAHVDAQMNPASIANVVNEFASTAPLDFYFHGGLAGVAASQATCEGLLQALYNIEGAQQRFNVQEFDVLARPHGREVAFDTANATVYPSFTSQSTRLDSVFRTLPNGTYLIGDAVMMSNACEHMVLSADATVAAAGVAARNIRKQFDGRPNKSNAFLKSVEEAVFAAVAAATVERAQKGSLQVVKDAVTQILRPAGIVEVVEDNLQRYLGGGPTKAGDKTYLVEALISALIYGDDLKVTAKTWLTTVHL